jgi:hypothetical protein
MLGPNEDESDSDSGEELERARENARVLDSELTVMRRVFHKWCRLAGVRGAACDDCSPRRGSYSDGYTCR